MICSPFLRLARDQGVTVRVYLRMASWLTADRELHRLRHCTLPWQTLFSIDLNVPRCEPKLQRLLRLGWCGESNASIGRGSDFQCAQATNSTLGGVLCRRDESNVKYGQGEDCRAVLPRSGNRRRTLFMNALPSQLGSAHRVSSQFLSSSSRIRTGRLPSSSHLAT
jgi:hypothetical protein